MRLGRVVRDGVDGPEVRLVAVYPDSDEVIDLLGAERARLEREGASPEAAERLARALFPPSMASAIAAGQEFLRAARRALEDPHPRAILRLSQVQWVSPIDPPVMRDASAFEEHLVNAHARGKREVPDYFYEAPAYYKMNPSTVVGPEAVVQFPGDTKYLDYELELAMVVGRAGRNLRPEEARHHLFALTIMNDFSARDVQAREMTSGFGPAKGKDFATALGPWLTTVDELPDLLHLTMVARVNGEEWSRGSTSSLMWSVEEVVAFASRHELIVPGEVIGTGTVGLGCGLELFRRLQPGDVVELEIEGLGTLRNRVGAPDQAPWSPAPKERRASVTLPTRERARDP